MLNFAAHLSMPRPSARVESNAISRNSGAKRQVSWNSQWHFFHLDLERCEISSQGRCLRKILQVQSAACAACAANHLKTRNQILRWKAALEVCRDYTWLSLERDIFALVSTSQHVSTLWGPGTDHGGLGTEACTAALSSCGRARCWGKVQWDGSRNLVLPRRW